MEVDKLGQCYLAPEDRHRKQEYGDWWYDHEGEDYQNYKWNWGKNNAEVGARKDAQKGKSSKEVRSYEGEGDHWQKSDPWLDSRQRAEEGKTEASGVGPRPPLISRTPQTTATRTTSRPRWTRLLPVRRFPRMHQKQEEFES